MPVRQSEFKSVKTKCPKCKSNNLDIIELWKNATISWDCRNGVIEINNGNLEPGNPHKVEGRCYDCGKHWTIRGVRQIDEIVVDI